MPPRRPQTNATLDAEAIRRAEELLADRRRSPAATVADLCALFTDLARVKRERDEAEAWWRAVLARPSPPDRQAPKGFAHKRSDFEGPMAYTLRQETSAIVRVTCEKCGRSEAYQLSLLLDRFGSDASMPGVLRALAGGCPKVGNFSDWCGLRYVDPIGSRLGGDNADTD